MGDVNQVHAVIPIVNGGGAARRRRRRRAPFGGRRRQRRQQNRQQDDAPLLGPEIFDGLFMDVDDLPFEDYLTASSDSEDEVFIADIPRDIVDEPEIFKTLETLVRARNTLKRKASELNFPEEIKLDPTDLVRRAVTAFKLPKGKGKAAAEELLDKMQLLAQAIQKVDPLPQARLMDRRPGEFQLPKEIQKNLSAKEIQILEACIDRLREAMINGMQFPGYEAIQNIVVDVRLCCRSDELVQQGRLTELVEMFVKADDSKRRQAEYHEAVRRQAVGYRRSKVLSLPESTIYHVPNIPKDNFELWTEEDIKDWIKLFIHKQEHRDIIECQHFTGFTLQMFLADKRTWKDFDWPFGLFIQLKSHFNRVANHRNNHVHQFR